MTIVCATRFSEESTSDWGGARIEVHVLHGHVVKEVVRATEALGGDIVCLGVPSEDTSGVIVSDLLRLSRKPVLVTTVAQP